MKNLLTSTALIATLIASSVSAAQLHHKGNTSDNEFPSGCQFTENTDGSYKYTESTKTWAVDDAADVSILVRQDPDNSLIVSYIEIIPVKYDGTPGETVWGPGGLDEWDADVDYTGGSVATSLTSSLLNWFLSTVNGGSGIGKDKIQIIDTSANTAVRGTSGVVEFDIGGTAKITGFGTNEIIDAGTEYRTSHMITCFQGGSYTPGVPASGTGGTDIGAKHTGSTRTFGSNR